MQSYCCVVALHIQVHALDSCMQYFILTPGFNIFIELVLYPHEDDKMVELVTQATDSSRRICILFPSDTSLSFDEYYRTCFPECEPTTGRIVIE